MALCYARDLKTLRNFGYEFHECTHKNCFLDKAVHLLTNFLKNEGFNFGFIFILSYDIILLSYDIILILEKES